MDKVPSARRKNYTCHVHTLVRVRCTAVLHRGHTRAKPKGNLSEIEILAGRAVVHVVTENEGKIQSPKAGQLFLVLGL